MRPRPIPLTTLAVACVLAVPATAAASPTMLTGVADENVLNGQTPGGAEKTVAEWQARGVQTVRMFAQWDKIAPSISSTKAPDGFKGADPASYDFSRLDSKIDLIRKHGMTVTLVVTGPGPVWGSLEPQRRNGTWKPDPKLFGQFATAVAQHVASRVDRYIVWNEPNISTWLQPQFSCTGTRCKPYSPGLYRQLAEAGYRAIHANDSQAAVAIGATSSFGDAFVQRAEAKMQPLLFLREMSCVTSRYHYRRSGSCKHFKRPVGDALAYHPHPGSTLTKKGKPYTPGDRSPNRNDARIGDISRITHVLDKLQHKHRLRVGGGSKRMPLWFDEYGYQTKPPSSLGIRLSLSAPYTEWGFSRAARSSRVQMMTQYEWFDETTGKAPGAHSGDGTTSRWQGGLFDEQGKPKPLNRAWDAPIFGHRTRTRGYVWGQVRPGEGPQQVTIQRRVGHHWKDYKHVTTNANGLFQVRVRRSTRTKYRFTYINAVTKQPASSLSTRLRKP